MPHPRVNVRKMRWEARRMPQDIKMGYKQLMAEAEARIGHVSAEDAMTMLGRSDVVIVDNGNIQLKVLEKRRNQLTCEVLSQGVLGSRRHIYLPGVRKAQLEVADTRPAVAVKPDGSVKEFTVKLGALTEAERQILADGCLINYYKNN